MSKNTIRISPKYGLNPTIPICFFCGKEKNEIALMGKMGSRNEDREAPRNAIIDYEPCDECRENMAKGITLIGVTTKQPEDNRPLIDRKNNLYPTGSWLVIKEEAAKRIFGSMDIMDSISKKRKCFVEESLINWLMKE